MLSRKCLASLLLLSQWQGAQALNIILNNDDGWASVHIRELYNSLTAAGHNAWISAPATDQSGRSGRISFSPSATLTQAAVYGSVPSGSPSFGHDSSDQKLWYYDGTPAACSLFALDYLVPTFWDNTTTPDLFITGPNFGTNEGVGMMGISGTVAGATMAIERGIPAIAVSVAAYGGEGRGYQQVVDHTASGLPDPARIVAGLMVEFVEKLIANRTIGGTETVLPMGYGININFPSISTLKDTSCVTPPFVQTRVTGTTHTFGTVLDQSKGTFGIKDVSPASGTGVNSCINGNCTVPGEEAVGKCKTSVSPFTIDYDAPDTAATRKVVSELGLPYQPDNVTQIAVVTTSNGAAATRTGAAASTRPTSGAQQVGAEITLWWLALLLGSSAAGYVY